MAKKKKKKDKKKLPSEVNFKWKQLSKSSPEEIEQLIKMLIEEAQDYTFKYGFTPWPMITIEKEKRPLYWNKDHWEIASETFIKAAKSQRQGYLRKQRENREYEEYLAAVKYQNAKPSTYDPDYHPRKLKKYVKKTPFPEHWARKFQQTLAVLEEWAKIHPEFGKIYYRHKNAAEEMYEKHLGKLMRGKDKSKGNIKAADVAKILPLLNREKYGINKDQGPTTINYVEKQFTDADIKQDEVFDMSENVIEKEIFK